MASAFPIALNKMSGLERNVQCRTENLILERLQNKTLGNVTYIKILLKNSVSQVS